MNTNSNYNQVITTSNESTKAEESLASANDPSFLLTSLVEFLTIEQMEQLSHLLQERQQQSKPPVEDSHHSEETNSSSSIPDREPPSEQEKSTEPVQETVPTKPKGSKRRKPTPVVPEIKPEEPVIELTAQAQAVFDEWASMPWFRGVRPKLTKTVADHCNTLAAYDPLPTAKDMLDTRQWYRQQHPDRKGWYLGNFVTAYPQYLSDQYQSDQERSEANQQASVPNEDTLVYWNPEGNRKCFNSMIWDWMPYSEAVKHGYTPEQKLSEAEVKNHENRKALRREVEEHKAQRLAPVPV